MADPVDGTVAAAADRRAARRERRRERSREEILDAARTVLLRDGVAAMTLEAVAREAGMSKTGLYYYFASKDELVFELVYGVIERHARAVDQAVARAYDAPTALRAIIRGTVQSLAPRIDDFRLAFLFAQVAGQGQLRWTPEQFARLRPLNELCLGGAAGKLRHLAGQRLGKPRIEPRLLAFLAYLSAIGMLTMKGLVESVNDPLVFTDDQLAEGLARVFEAAAAT
ncbi:MAG: helix-turn-helix domain-containing protein [Geminicoccaceae bacterium]